MVPMSTEVTTSTIAYLFWEAMVCACDSADLTEMLLSTHVTNRLYRGGIETSERLSSLSHVRSQEIVRPTQPGFLCHLHQVCNQPFWCSFPHNLSWLWNRIPGSHSFQSNTTLPGITIFAHSTAFVPVYRLHTTRRGLVHPWTDATCRPGSRGKQDDRDGRAGSPLPWAFTAFPENEVGNPTSQGCWEGCPVTNSMQFSRGLLSSFKGEPAIYWGSMLSHKQWTLFSSKREFHRASEEATRKQAQGARRLGIPPRARAPVVWGAVRWRRLSWRIVTGIRQVSLRVRHFPLRAGWLWFQLLTWAGRSVGPDMWVSYLYWGQWREQSLNRSQNDQLLPIVATIQVYQFALKSEGFMG